MQKRPRSRQGFSSSRSRSSSASLLRLLLLAVPAFLALGLATRSLLINSYHVRSDVDVLSAGDRIMASSLAYAPRLGPLVLPGIRRPRHNDLVIMRAPGLDAPAQLAGLAAAALQGLSLYTMELPPPEGHAWARQPLIRRVAAVPGDLVHVYAERIEIERQDGSRQTLLRQSLMASSDSVLNSYRLGPDEYYVLANSRTESEELLDSMHWGPVNRERFLARAIVRYWPFDQLRTL